MTEPEIYMSLAIRFLSGSTAAHSAAHELAGFACYHAFESAGGAYVTHYGQPYPHNHKAKLNAFEARCSGRLRHAVANLAITLTGLRNAFLYPSIMGTTCVHPMNTVTAAQVNHLHRRVSGIVGIIRPMI